MLVFGNTFYIIICCHSSWCLNFATFNIDPVPKAVREKNMLGKENVVERKTHCIPLLPIMVFRIYTYTSIYTKEDNTNMNMRVVMTVLDALCSWAKYNNPVGLVTQRRLSFPIICLFIPAGLWVIRINVWTRTDAGCNRQKE